MVGIAGYAYLGLLHYKLFAVMFVATSLAGMCGANVALWVGDRWLKPIFTTAVWGFALYLLFK